MASLFDALIKEGLITSEQLSDARVKQIGAKKPLHELLVEMGFIKEEDLLKTVSKLYDLPLIELARESIGHEVVKLLPYEVAARHGVFPIRREGDVLVLAMSNPQDIMAIDEIQLVTNLHVKPTLCSKSDIDQAINKHYQTDDSIYDILKNMPVAASFDIISEKEDGKIVIDNRFMKDETSVIVRLFNLIMKDAFKARASDIHIEPEEKSIKVRYRVDGDLKKIMEVPMSLHAELTARIKILAGMDIVEKRKPQDGRLKLLYQDRKIDLRLATIPTFYGEKVEMRILDPKAMMVNLESIGFDERNLGAYKKSILKPQGMVLVTGPTGSGKTTTIYATLNYVKNEKKNIVTIEDPIEYLIDGITQTQINPAKELFFSTALRSILRQDPNVIFVGEIRDKETADIAFRASLTGHLVFSTLHTNNSVGSITRLLDLGLEPYLIASSLVSVVAQRLVKKICPHCKEEYVPDAAEMERFQAYLGKTSMSKLFKGKGCDACGFSGYLGRMPILELFDISESIKALIARKAPEDEILLAAQREGFKLLSVDVIEKVMAGVTTLEELSRVVTLKETEASRMAAMYSGKVRILAVDDEEDILKVLVLRLSNAGYEVIKARDGKEALALAVTEKPDMVITDVTMPQMDGFMLTKNLRDRLETAGIPIIILTARSDKDSELKGIDAGADDYITKPYDPEKLLSRVKMLLRRKER
jgi:type IV pilus assembly protein PilB